MLTPSRFQQLHAQAGLTYSQISKMTRCVHRSQLAEYVTGKGGLRPQQRELIERVLIKAIQVRSAAMARLVGGTVAAA